MKETWGEKERESERNRVRVNEREIWVANEKEGERDRERTNERTKGLLN